jgi:hypothetical protein
MTKFEYTTFVLGGYPTVASKYQKIQNDIEAEATKGFFRKNKKQLQLLESVKKDFRETYTDEELDFSDIKQEQEFWVKKLAKQSAVELLSQGKVSSDTMFKVSCLDNDNFVQCIKETTKLSTHLNHIVQEAEKTVEPDDIVPEELMR